MAYCYNPGQKTIAKEIEGVNITFKKLNAGDAADIQDSAVEVTQIDGETKIVPKSGKTRLLQAFHSITSWGLTDAKGNPVAKTFDVFRNLDKAFVDQICDAAEEINNKVTEEDQEN